MVISAIWSILAGPVVDHISGTECIMSLSLHLTGRPTQLSRVVLAVHFSVAKEKEGINYGLNVDK